MQRISGPISGVFIATYAMPHPEGFLGYAKLCLSPPDDVWTCPALRKVVGSLCATSEEALDRAELNALTVISLFDLLRRKHPTAPEERLLRSGTLTRMAEESRTRTDPT